MADEQLPREEPQADEPLPAEEPLPKEEPQPAEAAPQAEAPQPAKKNRKPLLIGAGIVAAVVIIGCVLFAVQSAGDASAKEAMAADVSEGPAITERVIPSAWGDQSGFTSSSAEVSDFNRGFLSGTATGTVTVTAENGAYRLTDAFEVLCQNENGTWKVSQADVADERYAPIAAVSDEALVAHLPELMAKADEINGKLAYANPLNVGDFFNVDTEASVVSNQFDSGEDDARISLVRMIDGVAYEGALDAVLAWDAKAEVPDWALLSVIADPETERVMGSVVREGVPASMTNAQLASNQEPGLAEGQFWISYLTNLQGFEGSRYANISFMNDAENTSDMDFVVISNETGEVLYESPRMAPGTCLDYITLPEPLEPRTYSVTVQLTSYSPGWAYDDTLNVNRECTINVF